MAAAKKPARNKAVPSDRAIQYSDFDREGQQAANRIMKDRGRMKNNVDAVVQHATDNPGKSNDKRLRGLSNLPGNVKNVNVTLDNAADRRVEHFTNGITRADQEGVESGMGWYFGHHGDIKASAEEHGFGGDVNRVIEASALMSPQNSPQNEKSAINAIMAGSAGHDFDEKDMRRAGTKTNLKRATGHLLEDGPGIPNTAPKIHSYNKAIQNAAPDTDTHREYQDRSAYVRDVSLGREAAGQGRLDVWGKGESTEGILNPRGNTAEDTWMHTISLGQDLTNSVGKTNVAKTSSSDKRLGLVDRKTDDLGRSVHPSGKVGASQVQHAWNNEATIRAADTVGQTTGLTNHRGESLVPSVLVQETSWTEARRVAGKDPEYKKEMTGRAKAERADTRASEKAAKSQRSLF